MYAIYGKIYHQYIPNVSIYTIHESYGLYIYVYYICILVGGDWNHGILNDCPFSWECQHTPTDELQDFSEG